MNLLAICSTKVLFSRQKKTASGVHPEGGFCATEFIWNLQIAPQRPTKNKITGYLFRHLLVGQHPFSAGCWHRFLFPLWRLQHMPCPLGTLVKGEPFHKFKMTSLRFGCCRISRHYFHECDRLLGVGIQRKELHHSTQHLRSRRTSRCASAAAGKLPSAITISSPCPISIRIFRRSGVRIAGMCFSITIPPVENVLFHALFIIQFFLSNVQLFQRKFTFHLRDLQKTCFL